MERTTMSEEIERERAHPNTPSAPPRPAYRRRTQACPPHACDPTAGVRDGMETSAEENNSKPTTAAQEGLASCTARRQSADGRQDTRSSTHGLASDEREGKEQERLSLPDRPKPTAKSHLRGSARRPGRRNHLTLVKHCIFAIPTPSKTHLLEGVVCRPSRN